MERPKVLKVEVDTGRISLGMKPSLFTASDDEMDVDDVDVAGAGAGGRKKNVATEDPLMVNDDDEEEMEGWGGGDDSEDDSDDDDEEEEEEEEEEEDDDERDPLAASDSDDDDDDDDDASEPESDEMDVDDEPDAAAASASDSEDDEDSDEDSEDSDEDSEDSEDSDSDGDDAGKKKLLDDDVGLDWDADDAKKTSSSAAAAASADDNEKPKSKREKAREKANREMELHRKEQALRDAADRAPETAAEYEKLIMQTPRSSYAWLKFVAFHVSVGAYDDARACLERALKAIPASEEEERMNIWVAYLNLENKHGKPSPVEATERTFKRACQVANPKKLHLTLAGVHERSGNDANARRVLAEAVKKFSQARSSITLVPIRPRWRGERRSLRTFPGVSLRPPLAFNTRPRRLSTPTDAFRLHPDIRFVWTITLRARKCGSRTSERRSCRSTPPTPAPAPAAARSTRTS